ncbi:MAG: NAD-dependent epimerase/dehydratase family protein [Candidatus Auribacterota bacterium]|jgi:dTDP-L-rhamnose 4-epimerase|uniref:NAD-dependent epimerase/dehydratase family protein n=1 Tax=Candidatus Auribacter fodinae TaxID=2093366 RepID=A0A3A4R5R7_9BACT|nr:MAG: NAD-dependent epimerase/dehydratase family protein [Candidatus Auribacter fodinae]
MEHVLITGGAGFIGSHLADRLIAEGHEVTILDTLDPLIHPDGKPPAYMNHKAFFIKGDVCDYDHLRTIIKDQSVIVHLASRVGIMPSLWNIKDYWDVNVGGTVNILDILANGEHCCKKFVLGSSWCVYGEGSYICPSCGVKDMVSRDEESIKKHHYQPACDKCGHDLEAIPTPEDRVTNPSSSYALTKHVQETMVKNFSREYSFPAAIARFFPVYGPRQSLTNQFAGIIPVIINRLKRKKTPILFEDGGQIRDFIWIHDAIEILMRMIYSSDDKCRVYNVGSGRQVSIMKLAGIIARVMSSKIQPSISHMYRRGDIRACYADTSRLQHDLGIFLPVSLELGIDEMLEWAQTAESCDSFEKMIDVYKNKKIIDLN